MAHDTTALFLAAWDADERGNISALAREHGIDRSVAARWIAQALAAGYITRRPRPRVSQRIRTDGYVWCPRCADYLPPTQFYASRSEASGISGLCRQHAAEAQMARRKLTRRALFLPPDDYEALQAAASALGVSAPEFVRRAIAGTLPSALPAGPNRPTER